MRSLAASVVALVFGAVIVGAQTSDRPNLSGTWILDHSKCELSSTKIEGMTWVIDQQRTKIKVTETSPDQKGSPLEFECGIMGKECDLPGDTPHKVSMYFNGPVLVQFHRVGAKEDAVSRHSIKLSDDKKSLLVEINYLVPPDLKPEKLVFNKQ